VYTVHPARCPQVDFSDQAVRNRTAQKYRMEKAIKSDVIEEAACAPDQSDVLNPRDRLSNP
jgi:hypothetical protein